jgi:hypothetical protein
MVDYRALSRVTFLEGLSDRRSASRSRDWRRERNRERNILQV